MLALVLLFDYCYSIDVSLFQLADLADQRLGWNDYAAIRHVMTVSAMNCAGENVRHVNYRDKTCLEKNVHRRAL